MTGKALTVWGQEALLFIAEEVIVNLRYQGYWYDEEGNRILEKLSEEECRAALENQIKGLDKDYLSFREKSDFLWGSTGDAPLGHQRDLPERCPAQSPEYPAEGLHAVRLCRLR